MPEMDGVRLAKEIRKLRDAAALPLVLFSSLGRREANVENGLFAAFLGKPIKPSQLFDTLAGLFASQAVEEPQAAPKKSLLDPEMARNHPLRSCWQRTSWSTKNWPCACCSRWDTAQMWHQTA